jgi:hypothetical protein
VQPVLQWKTEYLGEGSISSNTESGRYEGP